MSGLSLKSLRTIAAYTALTLGVTVGGVTIGAMVVAPVVARAKPALQLALDHKAINTTLIVNTAIAATSRISTTAWAVLGMSIVLLVGGSLFWRRRKTSAPKTALALPLVAAIKAKPAKSWSSRTPRAVVALAESGASAADIARRTRMPLDAVAMCLSMGTLGARQLRPPTA